MTQIDFAYINYEHGGNPQGSSYGSSGAPQFGGLVRLLGDDDRWPDIAVMGEAERYEFDGGAGLWGAAHALAEASGRAYTPVLGTLPREWGPIGPAMFVDAQKIRVRHFYSGREPDFYARNRNLLRVSLAGRREIFNVVGWHGDILDTNMRLHDAKTLGRYANPWIPTALLGDWNSTLDGDWAATDFDKYEHPWQYATRVRWRPRQRPEDLKADTRMRDYLCGWWDEEKQERVGGMGFYDVAERLDVRTPTNFPNPNGRECTAIDGAMVNAAWKDSIVAGSVRVHEPAVKYSPDSDHKRFSFTIDA